MSELSGERSELSLDTAGSGFVPAIVEKFWSRSDDYRSDVYRLFMVISEGVAGEHVARAVYATSEDDARQAHQENYAGETVLAVQQ
jgi:hypothetical protein